MSEKITKVLWTNWGPEITFDGRYLRVHDLNPERKTFWMLSRKELFWMGVNLIIASFRRKGDE